jgi:dolichyl-phosphate beta-glucosyltransferase
MQPARPLALSVIVPAFNEQRRIGTTLTALIDYLRQQAWEWEVRVVDDGSRDRTAEVAESFSQGEPRVVVQREPHRGKGGAVKAGILAARGEYRFICDADLSMPIHEIRRFLPPALKDFDVAIGSREGKAARRIGEPAHRHVMGRLFNLAVQQLTLPGIEDSQCGFKMFTARAANSIFPRVTVDGWAFDVEVLTVARAQGLRIVQVPIEWRYSHDSQLSMIRDGFGMALELLRIKRRLRRGHYRIR